MPEPERRSPTPPRLSNINQPQEQLQQERPIDSQVGTLPPDFEEFTPVQALLEQRHNQDQENLQTIVANRMEPRIARLIRNLPPDRQQFLLNNPEKILELYSETMEQELPLLR